MQIFKTQGYEFPIHRNHPLLKASTFKYFKTKKEVPFTANIFSQLVFYRDARDECLIELIKTILSLSVEVIEKVYIEKLLNTLEDKLKEYVSNYDININSIIKDDQCQTLENFKQLLQEKMSRDCRRIECQKEIRYFCNIGNFEKIYDYDFLPAKIIKHIEIYNFDFPLMRYIIDNIADWDICVAFNYVPIKAIHYILKYSSKEVVDYAKSKGVKFDQNDIDKNPIDFKSDTLNILPIHLIMKYIPKEAIHYLMGDTFKEGECQSQWNSNSPKHFDSLDKINWMNLCQNSNK